MLYKNVDESTKIFHFYFSAIYLWHNTYGLSFIDPYLFLIIFLLLKFVNFVTKC